jgi:TatA/E family protein of Tat protein translocase
MGPEWIVVAVVAVIVIFGVNKLPQIARNVGKAQGEFKKGLKEGEPEPPETPTAAPTAAAPTAEAPPAEAPPAVSPSPQPAEEAPKPPEQPPTDQSS